jgi:hypothetical protein
MDKTIWTGGKFGNEPMPTGITSMYYSEIYNAIPITDVGGANDSSGYFDGDTNKILQVNKGFRDLLVEGEYNGIKCTVGGVPVDIVPVSQSDGKFRISDSVVGFAKVTYLPLVDTLYFSEPDSSIYIEPVRKRLVKATKVHVEEILGSLNDICDYLQIPKRKYSIQEFTGNAEIFTGSISENTPLVLDLFKEIRTHIIDLNGYVITNTNIAADVSPISLQEYNFNTVNAYMFELFRIEINAIEVSI